ncbi:ferrochelatase [Dysgonomonas sp. ZJ709]|uniref:ferrochelatase n=1 Tax=Dysgonomonas sp. ZJ709 TaxID=2709797 RepID=UPI0013EAC74C|nr:ferrochelatase [Dysgonomonas sp. ZJ709]
MKGVLLVNTGSPKACTRTDVKFFVGAMLSDPKVMTVPDWFRPILVKGIILPLRQFSSTAHYSLIWDHKRNISPLLYNMQQLAAKLEEQSEMPVEVAMRYGEPSVALALERLMEKNDRLHEVIVLPMFPQYAESSYKTVVDWIGQIFFQRPYPFRLKIIEPYFNHPAYINALVESLKPYIEQDFDKLVFSFHSLPLTHVEEAWKKGKEFDYVYQTKETVRLVLNQLNVDVRKTRQVYSSAMGRKWLKPGLDETIQSLAEGGAKNIIVISPGFSVDNLETLYDVGVRAKDLFIKHGGTRLDFVPCLNSRDCWVDAVQKIIS